MVYWNINWSLLDTKDSVVSRCKYSLTIFGIKVQMKGWLIGFSVLYISKLPHDQATVTRYVFRRMKLLKTKTRISIQESILYTCISLPWLLEFVSTRIHFSHILVEHIPFYITWSFQISARTFSNRLHVPSWPVTIPLADNWIITRSPYGGRPIEINHFIRIVTIDRLHTLLVFR